MNQYLTLPHFDPTIFTLGDSNIGLRWYGLMYLLGFILHAGLRFAVLVAQIAVGQWSKLILYFQRFYGRIYWRTCWRCIFL